eukprot:CAMPEP_0176243886 /NCGR_PEP_ID=MMETSP0121_2-20121125/31150_1 /TAXON_ID=160619 /ORGANISM="Kryptoperidinium foliaceum, Strain CCMP 1326" /LENGTH=317 /DNA_ID=CAMNT_0017583483 /DNA_START=98 /DNA_END=1051 /DNA_ORIENTATION=+
MMSGNAIFMGKVMFGNDPFKGEPHRLSYYLVVIATFLLGSISFLCVERRYPNRGASIVSVPFAAVMLVLELVAISDLITPFTKSYHVLVLGYTPLFGILSSATLNGRLGTTTTMATGHLLSLGNLLVKRVLDGPLSLADWRKTCMSMQILLWIILGATVGAEVQSRVAKDTRGHGALTWVAPAMLVLFFAHDHLSKPRSVVKALQRRRRMETADSNQREGDQKAGFIQADVHVPRHEFDNDDDEEEEEEEEREEEHRSVRAESSKSPTRSANLLSRLFERGRSGGTSASDGYAGSSDAESDVGSDPERLDTSQQVCD